MSSNLLRVLVLTHTHMHTKKREEKGKKKLASLINFVCLIIIGLV